MVEGSAPVVKLRVGPFTVLPAVSVWEYMLYVVLGYMPAISNVMVVGGWQFTQFVAVAGTVRRLLLKPDPHGTSRGACRRAEQGYQRVAVGRTTGVLPLTSGVTWKCRMRGCLAWV
jgi:hypothetical protein